MGRAKILNRVWTTSAAVALIFSVGTWIILDERDRWIVADDVMLAEMLMERAGACVWTNEPVERTYWTSLRTRHVGTAEVWGGYEWVTISNVPANAIAEYSRTYHYQGRQRTLDGPGNARVIPDRGFCDVYTNGGYTLVDLGPAGGGAKSGFFGTSGGFFPVGGWVLLPSFFLNRPLFLPRFFHVDSGWFLRPVSDVGSAAYGYLSALDTSTLAPYYDPSEISVACGPANTNGYTYWQPVEVYFTTNEILQLSWTHDQWLDADLELSGTEPMAVLPPVRGAAILDTIARDCGSEDRYYLDPARANTSGTSDFSGWTNPALPAITLNAGVVSNLAAWSAAVSAPTRSLAAYQALGEAMVMHDTLRVESTVAGGVERDPYWSAVPTWRPASRSGWTNVVWRQYWSRVVSNETFAGAVADLASYPGWCLQAETNFPLANSVWYALWDRNHGDYSGELRLCYEYQQGAPFGFTGAGHNTNGYHDIAAHGWFGALFLDTDIPAGETVVAGPTNQWFLIERATGVAPSIHVFDTRVPAFTGAPPASFFAHLTEAAWGAGYEIGEPAVAARPNFDVYDYR